MSTAKVGGSGNCESIIEAIIVLGENPNHSNLSETGFKEPQ
jgi:hypothetical protein